MFVMQNVDFKDLKIKDKEITNTHLNVGVSENISIKELAFLIKDIVGFNGDIVFNKDRPNGAMNKLTDCSKINALGWKAKIKLEDGIKMMYEWYLKEQNIRQ